MDRPPAVVRCDPGFGPNLDARRPRTLCRFLERKDLELDAEAAARDPGVTALAVEQRGAAELRQRVEGQAALDPPVGAHSRPADLEAGPGEQLADPLHRRSGVRRQQARFQQEHRLSGAVESDPVAFLPLRRGASDEHRRQPQASQAPETGRSRGIQFRVRPLMARPTLLLVDGNNLLFRSFFALPPLTRSDGFPNGALHGFVSTLRKLLREEAPEFAAVAFDPPGPTFRHASFPDYKAHRPETPPELALQMPLTRRVSHALGVAVVEVLGVEADDVIGSLAAAAGPEGYRVLVVSGDKDLLQVVDQRVRVVDPRTPNRRLDPAAVEAKLGVPPRFVPDYLGLVGDSVDNIPGVPGIGPKTAKQLIAAWGGVEDILAHREEISRKRTAALLTEHEDKALLSRDLARLRLDVAVPEAGAGLEGLRYRGAKNDEARSLFEELELRTHARDFVSARPARLPEVTTASGLPEIRAVLDAARNSGVLSVHAVFGASRDRGPEPLAALGLAASEESAVFVAVGAGVDAPGLAAELTPVFRNGVEVIGHGVQSFVRWWFEGGASSAEVSPRVVHDSQVAAWLLNTTRRAQGFGEVLRDYTGLGMPDDPAPAATLFGPAVPDARLGVSAAWQHALRAKLDPLLGREGLAAVFAEIEMPLLPVLARIETRGITLDADALKAMSRDFETRIADLTARIHQLCGLRFDIQSPKQLGEVLFERLGLRQTARTKKLRRASTRAAVLEELAAEHEVPRLVLEYRELAKAKSTWVDPLPGLVSKTTGRLHTRLHQAVVATGRLSSTDPNLQNIPIRTDLGRRMRRTFVAAPGKRLISADYSQIELRILAHLSGDPALTEAFRSGEDIHDRTAREVFSAFGLSPEEARRRAKIVNFSVIYGKTAFTLAKEIGTTTGEAQAFIEAYFDRYAGVRDLVEAIKREARELGQVRTLFGRARHLPEIRTTQRARREAAERMAVNAPIQGTAADLIKIAMLRVDRALEPTSGRILLQVHDELLVEADTAEADAVGEVVRVEMEAAAELAVPLVAGVAIAPCWEH